MTCAAKSRFEPTVTDAALCTNVGFYGIGQNQRKYCQEHVCGELVAEIGNCRIWATLGLTPSFQQSGAQIEGWLPVIKGDNCAIFRKASEVPEVLDFVESLTERSRTLRKIDRVG